MSSGQPLTIPCPPGHHREVCRRGRFTDARTSYRPLPPSNDALPLPGCPCLGGPGWRATGATQEKPTIIEWKAYSCRLSAVGCRWPNRLPSKPKTQGSKNHGSHVLVEWIVEAQAPSARSCRDRTRPHSFRSQNQGSLPRTLSASPCVLISKTLPHHDQRSLSEAPPDRLPPEPPGTQTAHPFFPRPVRLSDWPEAKNPRESRNHDLEPVPAKLPGRIDLARPDNLTDFPEL